MILGAGKLLPLVPWRTQSCGTGLPRANTATPITLATPFTPTTPKTRDCDRSTRAIGKSIDCRRGVPGLQDPHFIKD